MSERTLRRRHAVDAKEKLPQSGLSHWFSRFASTTADPNPPADKKRQRERAALGNVAAPVLSGNGTTT